MKDIAKVFISYSTRDTRDNNLANLIRNTLIAQNVDVWMAPHSISYGKEWKKEIVSGVLDESTHYLVILSAASIHSSWVLREISLAKRKKLSDDNFTILTIQIGSIGEYRNKSFIEGFQKIPFTDDREKQVEVILEYFGVTPTSRMDNPTVQQTLYQIMAATLDLDDFKELCFKLGVKYDDLRGESLKSKIIYLVELYNRKNKLQILAEQIAPRP